MKLNIFKRIFLATLVFLCWISIVVCASAYVFLTTTWGAKIASAYLIEVYIPFCKVDIGSYQGTIEKGLTLKNVTISRIPKIKDAIVHVQDLHIQVPLTKWNQLTAKIINAKINLAAADPLVFNGTIKGLQVEGNCYTQSIDAKQVVSALDYSELARSIYGFITHLDFDVSGTVWEPRLRGHFIVDKFIYKNTQVTDGFSHLDLTIVSLGEEPKLKGFIIMESAFVKVEKIGIDLTTSKVDFKGDVKNFDLDIHGSTKVNDVTIDMSIKGTLQRPLLLFNSDPPLPEEKILILLATGKGWAGIEAEQGFGLRRKLTETFNVGMEVEERQSQVGRDQATGYARTLEGQMKMNERFSLNVAQKYLPDAATQASSPGVGSTSQKKENESEIYLQYKQRF